MTSSVLLGCSGWRERSPGPPRRRYAADCGNSSPASTRFTVVNHRRGRSSTRPASSPSPTPVPSAPSAAARCAPRRRTARRLPVGTSPVVGPTAGDLPAGRPVELPCPCMALRLRPHRPPVQFAFLNRCVPWRRYLRPGSTAPVGSRHHSALARAGSARPGSRTRPWPPIRWLRGLWKPGDDGDRIQRYMNDGTIIDGELPASSNSLLNPATSSMASDTFHAAPSRLTEPR